MDDDQQFCLRWNNHQSTLISVFDTLLENGTLVDCTLAAEGKFLKAHKVVLSACSPYFAALLSQQYDKHPIFILKDVKFQELRAMMDYMYRGEVNISQDQLAALLKAAESLQIKGLSDNRGSTSSTASSQQKQQQSEASATKTLPPPVPVNKASGLTIENKRPLKSELLDSDVSGSREGSTSPTSRKRKKIRRRSVETNNVIDNHDQHSNSSSHSMHTSLQPQALALTSSSNVAAVPATNNAATSLSSSAATPSSSANVLASAAGTAAAAVASAALKKTESAQQQQVAEALKLQLVKQQQQQQSQQQAQNTDDDDEPSDTEQGDGQGDDSDNEMDEPQIKRQAQGGTGSTEGPDGKSINQSELMIEPKNEYDDGQDENVEDLTLDEEELLDDLDQAGPSHGEGSSQGYAQWQMEREQNEAFMAAQDAVGGQHRDAQVSLSTGSSTPTGGHGGQSSSSGVGGGSSGSGHGGGSTEMMVIQSEVILTGGGGGAVTQPPPPPMDDQPCDLRLLTPSYLREFAAAESKATQRDLIAAAAAAAAAVAATGGAVSASGAGGPLPVPLFKGINITTPPSVPSSIGGAYTCSRCGNSYARPHSLNRHIRFECGVEPKFECPVCHKKSKHKHNLVLHMRTHQHR